PARTIDSAGPRGAASACLAEIETAPRIVASKSPPSNWIERLGFIRYRAGSAEGARWPPVARRLGQSSGGQTPPGAQPAIQSGPTLLKPIAQPPSWTFRVVIIHDAHRNVSLILPIDGALHQAVEACCSEDWWPLSAAKHSRNGAAKNSHFRKRAVRGANN